MIRRYVAKAVIATAGILAISAPAMAGEWESFEGLAGGTVSTGQAVFAVACSKGDLIVRISLPADSLHPDIAALETIDLTLSPDVRGETRSVASVSDLPFRRDDDGEAYSVFKGGAAVDWARLAMRAKRDFQVAWTPRYDSAAGYPSYNTTTFSAAGSSKVIRPALEECGV